MGTAPQPSASYASLSEQVAADMSPAMLINSDREGRIVNCNGAARRLVGKPGITDWSDLIPAADLNDWTEPLMASCRSHEPIDSICRVRRFDNAIRSYILRAEPHFSTEGTFQGHLTSGLDITEFVGQHSAIADHSTTRQIAGTWHDQLVSNVTIIASSADIIDDLIPPDSSPLLSGAVDKLSQASGTLRHQLQTLSSISRGN